MHEWYLKVCRHRKPGYDSSSKGIIIEWMDAVLKKNEA
jgi:hypothetical protein